MENIFDFSGGTFEREVITELFSNKNVRIEKIVSNGQISESWYDQSEGEWVSVLVGEGRLIFEDESETSLKAGEHIFIPPHKKHKVSYCTSPCVWLCVFTD